MSVTGRELRESLNGGSKTESSENLVLYGAIAGVILIGAIVFVTIGLMSGPGSSAAVVAESDIQSAVEDTPTVDISEMRREEMSKYNQTKNNIQSCMRSRDARKKFKEIEAGYERRNAKAVASWDKQRSQMLQKIENGTASSAEIALWQMNGGAQKDIMNELSEQLSMTGSFEMLTSDECLKFGSDVRMKKYDIKARP